LLRSIVAALLAGVALAGCAPAHGGAAALVGDERIATERLSAAVDRVLAFRPGPPPPPAETVDVQREQLGRLITSDLLAAAADGRGVRVTASEVDARLAQFRTRLGGQQMLEEQAARVGVAAPELRDFVRDLVLADKLGDALLAGAPLQQVRAAHILVQDKATADRLAAQVRAHPERFATLARQFSVDTGSRARGGDLGYQTRGAFVPAFSEAMFGGKKGDVLVVRTDFGWHVIRILDRRSVRPGQLPASEFAQVVQQERNARVAALLTRTARRLGVTVNPRFGRWDARTLTVAPPRDELSVPDRREQPTEPAPGPG
jgi:parvulin-like peptidyl-prolyl isomerase